MLQASYTLHGCRCTVQIVGRPCGCMLTALLVALSGMPSVTIDGVDCPYVAHPSARKLIVKYNVSGEWRPQRKWDKERVNADADLVAVVTKARGAFVAARPADAAERAENLPRFEEQPSGSAEPMQVEGDEPRRSQRPPAQMERFMHSEHVEWSEYDSARLESGDHVATRDESYDAVRESRDTATAEVERLRAENTALHERVLSLLHGGTEQVCSLPARPAVHGCDTVRVHR